MDLLKIFRMQEPVPKDLLSKNNEIGKYKEVVQEKDVLLRNSRARIRELEQQVADLENENQKLSTHVNTTKGQDIIYQYEQFFSKIMADSEELIKERNLLESKLIEIESFSKDILEKYEKSKEVINQYEEAHEQLKSQILEYENIINSLTNEHNNLKEYIQSKLCSEDVSGITKSKENISKKGGIRGIEEILKNNQIQMSKQNFIQEGQYLKSMFEPLKSLEK